MKLTSWRVALRIARRDALRAKGRSALIVGMIALPVLGVAGADVAYRSAQLTPQERIERSLGTSDALVGALSPGRTVAQAPNADDGTTVLADPEGQKPSPEQVKGAATDPTALVAGLLPPGSTLTSARPGPEASASSRSGLLLTSTAEADLGDPLWRGKVDVVKGRAPHAPYEAAVTQAFLDQSGLALGDTTTVKGVGGKPFTLTAVAEYPGDLSKVALIGRPGELIAPLVAAEQNKPLPAAGANTDAAGADPATADAAAANPPSWLVRLPAGAHLGWAEVQEFNRYGYTLTARTVALDPPARSAVPYYRSQKFVLATGIGGSGTVVAATIAGMALLETALLAGPAFAVGARRSRRQLALLAAGGGDRAQVRAVVLGGGVVLGLAGALGGVLVGTGLVAVLRPWLESAAGSRFGHFGVHPLDLLAVGAVGVGTALVAAVLPAVQAARQDVVAALAGRVTAKAPSKRLAAFGAVLVATGTTLALLGAGGSGRPGMPVAGGYDAQTLAILGGSATAELGMLACTPLLVGLLGRLARHLPLAPRLTLRDAARQRGRTAPAIAAVLAAVAGAVAITVYTASSDAESRSEYRATAPTGAVTLTVIPTSPLPQLQAAITADLPGLGARADVYQLEYHFCPNCASTVNFVDSVATGGYQWSAPVLAGDPTVLHNMFGLHDPAAEAALAAGQAVVFDSRYVKDGKATFHAQGESGGGPAQPGQASQPGDKDVSVPAVLIDNPVAAHYGIGLVSPGTAQRLGLATQLTASVWLPAAPPSSRLQQQATAAVNHLDSFAELAVERGYQSKSDLTTLALSGFAALVVLGAAGIATGLAAADSRPDQATLTAVGAPPRTRRVLSGLQCGTIALLGAALGTLCGYVPAVALRKAHEMALHIPHEPIITPWSQLLLILVALPLLAALVASATTRSRMPLARRID
ncbi:putative ABC transport system permease protein [Kitasatospora sp. GAS204A]|uniref:FtsX-like permease family protein n=1 Tax=unclassified Kitasatospora TaxID=2633591 RepID=UPI00247315EE|nr:FtsX-like permease family protein [Kitasatospora sp. GAS204B]MDH6118532.1 putative ABC transport system permease protein [Kitasatospora sp. GAS204B]